MQLSGIPLVKLAGALVRLSAAPVAETAALGTGFAAYVTRNGAFVRIPVAIGKLTGATVGCLPRSLQRLPQRVHWFAQSED